jgi:Ser/Thr protein kinase RdoA (MazF antagonist)
VRSVERIGAGYGMSGGAVYRVEADSEEGPLSFVLKRESAAAVDGALRFHRAVGARLAGSIPTLLGGSVDRERDTGVLLLEDVAPAAQGDVLRRCTDAEAAAVVRTLARLHAGTWGLDGMPPWTPRVLAPDDWEKRLDSAAARYPAIIPAGTHERLRDLPERALRAADALAAGESAWIHGDAHLDNVLFRPDGTAVLLDWSGVVVGPPTVDLARVLTEGVDAGARPELAERLVAAYTDELGTHGVRLEADDVRAAVKAAVVLLVQTAVAWAAREPVEEPVERARKLQENLLRSALGWPSVV